MVREDEKTTEEEPVEVPWTKLPISEPTLPGEGSVDLLWERGWPMRIPGMVSVIAGINTQQAQRLLDEGKVTIEGKHINAGIAYVHAGAEVIIDGKKYRLGRPGPGDYGYRPDKAG